MRLRPIDGKERRAVQLANGVQARVVYVPPRYGMKVKLRLPDGSFISRHMDDVYPIDVAEEAS